MRYAIISDIHGNLPALNAVLSDASKLGVDRYLFVGDYYADLPYPNEVVETIRCIDQAYVIRGNKEDYLKMLQEQDQTTWRYEQVAALYWNYRNIESRNLDYLINLPEEITIKDEKSPNIHMFHSPDHLFKATRMKELSSTLFALRMKQQPFTHQEYLGYVQELLESDEKLNAIVTDLSAGIYIFGHTHVQWHAYLGNCLLINSGSCGLPLDFNRAAPYTIVECLDDHWKVEERRVSYDVEATIENLKSSELYREARIWCDVMIQQLQSGEEKIGFFLKHVEHMANELNSHERPYLNDIWNLAAAQWFGY